jgi:MoaA/NifB/PqqE/SkfB family radical SAM enzyme
MIKGNKSYFFKRLKEKHIPLHVQIELTTQCNNNCVHCIREKNIENELNIQEIKQLISQLANLGCMQLTFTGGEPLLREDFFQICKFARSKGIVLRLFSNATLIDSTVARRLKKLKFKEIRISLFSTREEIHDSITQTPGSLRKTLRAIRLLKKDCIPFRISTVIMKHNIYELQGLQKKAKQENWRLSLDPTIYPTYAGLPDPLLNRLSNKEIELLRDKHLLNCARYEGINSKSNELNYFYLANLHCYIAADGRVFPHATIRLPLGNLRSQSFKEIWENSSRLNWLRNLNIDDFECSNCGYSLDCLWNLGLALSEHGEITVRPEEYCRITSIMRGGK